jgi:4-aminobutyrate aminotransferase-like enzyme
VETALRRIVTDIPAPATVPFLEKLHDMEPVAMRGQPPILWDHAEGFQVWDMAGNCWIDWSSGVLITNTGHGRPEIIDAVVKQAAGKLLTSYCFPTEIRYRLVEKLAAILPEPLKKVFLLTTGSEAVECAIKLCRTHGVRVGGRSKNVIVSFDKAFHGRTLGAQQAGGIPALKEWIVNFDPGFVQVPFPDGFRTEDTSFDYFLTCLAEQGIEPSNVAGVMLETYQGGSAAFAPPEYMKALREWSAGHKILLVCDEVQAGFGRTGKKFGFMHYGIVPDVAACGKGISGGLPLAAVLGTEELMKMYGPGEMTSTHSANPICAAAALANLQVIRKEKLVENAAKLAPVLAEGAERIAKAARGKVGNVTAAGLVAALQFTKPGTTEPQPDDAWEMVRRAIQRGVMLFAPVGVGGCAIKINPPLMISEEPLREGLGVLEDIAREL